MGAPFPSLPLPLASAENDYLENVGHCLSRRKP